MSHDDRKAKDDLLWPAVDHWLTGLLFATLLSGAVVLVAARMPFVEEIEALGVDASMRFNADLSKVDHLDAPSRKGLADFVFIDLDAATCRDAGGDRLCDRRSPASGAAAALVANALLAAPAAAQPRLIILDVRLWESDPAAPVPKPLSDLLAAASLSNVPILAPAPAIPIEEDDPDSAAEGRPQTPAEKGLAPQISIDWMEAPEALRTGPIRFAPALVRPDGADGVVREYPAYERARMYDGNGVPDHPRSQVVATLPYLASLYAAPGQRGLADCVAGRAKGSLGKPCDKPAPAPQSETKTRLLFTMPPADRSPGRRPPEAGDSYQYFQSSELVASNGALRIDPGRMAGKVVIVGFGGPGGLDRHVTPIGEMSGAELILNALHSFAANENIGPEPLDLKVRREMASAAISSIPFLLFWLANGHFWRWAGASIRRQMAAAVATAVVFFAMTGVAAMLTTVAITVAWRFFYGVDSPFDVLLPIVILALESFADAAKFLIDHLHHHVSRTRRRILPKVKEASHGRA